MFELCDLHSDIRCPNCGAGIEIGLATDHMGNVVLVDEYSDECPSCGHDIIVTAKYELRFAVKT